MRTKGEVEAEICKAMVRFEVDYMGRGPEECRARIIEDMLLIRLTGVLTLAERQLTKTSDGVELIKRVRSNLIENARPLLFQVLGDITGAKVMGMHTDISTVTGERIMVFTLDRELEKALPRKNDS